MLWFLDFIFPDWIIHIILAGGIVALLISRFVPLRPEILPYKIIITIAAWLAVGYGLFMEGSIWKDDVWAEKVREAEMKQLQAEKKASEATGKIKYVYVVQREKIRDNQQAAQQEVKAIADKINAECKVAPDVVNIINKYSEGQVKR